MKSMKCVLGTRSRDDASLIVVTFSSCDNIVKYIEVKISTMPRSTFAPHREEQVAQLSQRDRAAEWVSYGQKWKTGTGRQYLRTI